MDPIIFLDLQIGKGFKQMVALDSIEYIREVSSGSAQFDSDPGLTYCRTKSGHEFYSTESLDKIRERIVEALTRIYTDS